MNIYKFDPKTLQTPITFIYDGKNTRWSKEAAGIKEKNKDGKLKMVDSSAAGADLGGIKADQVADHVFARDASGKVVTGVEAVHAAHHAVGFGSWFTLYRAPGFFCEGHGYEKH